MALVGSVLLIISIVVPIASGATFPTGCAYHEEVGSTHLYSCDFSSVSLPLTYASFSNPLPQWIRIYKINGNINANSFTGFGSYDTTQLSRDKHPTLQLHCNGGGSLNLQAGSFATLGYIQEIEIAGCTVTLPDNVFQDFGTLNKITIRGGTLTLNSGTFNNVLLDQISNYPDPRAELTIKDLTLSGGTLPSNVFDSLNSTRFIKIENVGLTTVDAATFTQNKAVRHISLKNNAIVDTLPTTLFDGLDGLIEFDQTDIQWTCTCDNLWWWKKSIKKNMTVIGPAVCNSPADSAGVNVGKYYDTNCVTTSICGDTMGVAMGTTCLGIGYLIGFGIIFVCLVCVIVSIACICHLRKSALGGPPTRRKPPPPGSKPRNGGKKQRRGSGWV